MRKFKIMRKFYINNREVETVEKFLSEFTKSLFSYTDYITEFLNVKLTIISEELSNLIQVIIDGSGEYRFDGIDYRVE